MQMTASGEPQDLLFIRRKVSSSTHLTGTGDGQRDWQRATPGQHPAMTEISASWKTADDARQSDEFAGTLFARIFPASVSMTRNDQGIL
ncbi:MAG: hypothetical protein PHT99_02610 [Methanoregula sp.]|nr:hypothetical protein [Methanoregula sp.]